MTILEVKDKLENGSRIQLPTYDPMFAITYDVVNYRFNAINLESGKIIDDNYKMSAGEIFNAYWEFV